MLDAGDMFFSTKNLNKDNVESERYRASVMIEAYQKIGYDAINIGNYELLSGLKFLKSLDEKCSIPFISANLTDAKTGKLLFEPYIVIERNGLTLGIIGVTGMKPDTLKSVASKDYVESGNAFIKKLKKKVDLIAVLANVDRKEQQQLSKSFPEADFIFTSGSTNMTRKNSPQKEDGPFVYSFGKQGKYLSVLTTDIKNSNTKLVDVSTHKNKIKSINKRFERLQKKDPDKSLEEIYSSQANVLRLIDQYRLDIAKAEASLKDAVNTINFETIALSRSVKDDKDILAFVDKSLETCNRLNKSPAKNKSSDHAHKGHNHGSKISKSKKKKNKPLPSKVTK
ncbi:MAG: hypothetical protein CMG62_08705 [Candidatus Marinimicrobia bacterium]|nr:hypothetical protein [Candidatus Neomarinimicrobiota bacterium]